MVKCSQILDEFNEVLIAHISDYQDNEISSPSSINNPHKNCLLYVPNQKDLPNALKSEASLLIIDKKINLTNIDTHNKTIFVSKNLQASMALINQRFFTHPNYKKLFNGKSGIHPSAQIADSAQIGKNATIGPGACIYDDCIIGDNVYIGANSTIDAGSVVGDSTHIFPLVYLGHNTQVGKHCKILSNTTIGSDGFGYGQTQKGEHLFKPHLGRVVIEDYVDIGAGVCIDRGTYEDSKIGYGTKIDNMCHFGHNFVTGKYNLFTGGVMAAGSVTIGDHCIFGGGTLLTGHIQICSQVMVGGRSGVSKSITKPGQYAGYPLQKLKDNLKTMASLPHLTEIRKTVNKLSKI